MAEETRANLSIDPDQFRKFILGRKRSYEDLGGYASCIVLSAEVEPLIEHLFFKGKLSDLVTWNTDRSGKIRMFLAGVKTRFTTKVDVFHSLWILGSDVPPVPNPEVTPTTGPGSPLGGGTPIAMAIAA